MNEEAMTNLEINVVIVDSQTSFDVCVFSDSSDMCIPIASDNESAIAIVSTPPMTASLEFVTEYSPIMSPIVVIIPEVVPKQMPTLNECFNYPSPLVHHM